MTLRELLAQDLGAGINLDDQIVYNMEGFAVPITQVRVDVYNPKTGEIVNSQVFDQMIEEGDGFPGMALACIE